MLAKMRLFPCCFKISTWLLETYVEMPDEWLGPLPLEILWEIDDAVEVSSHDGDDEAMFKKSENKGLLIILTTFEIINIEIKQILYFNILFYFFEYIFVA